MRKGAGEMQFPAIYNKKADTSAKKGDETAFYPLPRILLSRYDLKISYGDR